MTDVENTNAGTMRLVVIAIGAVIVLALVYFFAFGGSTGMTGGTGRVDATSAPATSAPSPAPAAPAPASQPPAANPPASAPPPAPKN